MSNYRRPRSKNDDDRDEGGFAQDSDQKIAASNTRTRDSADGKGGQPVRAQNTINRGPVQGRNILDRSSPGGSTNDQILASIPAAQLALTDLSGIQALPLQIGSEQLLSMALQHALYQGLGAMNTTSRSRPQLPTNVAGARSSTLEGKNASRTSHPDTSRLSTTSMMVKNFTQFSLVVNQTNTYLLNCSRRDLSDFSLT